MTVIEGTALTGYASVAMDYLKKGWHPLPVPSGCKTPVPKGFTGGNAKPVGAADVQRWCGYLSDGNIALRLPKNVIGIDVDAYKGQAAVDALAAASAVLGSLPETAVSTSRSDGVSGIRFFRLPEGMAIGSHAEARFIEDFGTDGVSSIEFIRWNHRYALVYPSVHPDTGDTYQWGSAYVVGLPAVQSLEELPLKWVQYLCTEVESETTSVGDDDSFDSDEDFDTPEGSERSFSRGEVEGIVTATLDVVRSAKRGQINETLNKEAFYLAHFSPVFYDEKELKRELLKAQRDAWVASGGNDDGDYRAAKTTIVRAFKDGTAVGNWLAVEGEGDPLLSLETGSSDNEEDGNEEVNEELKTSDKKSGAFFTDAAFSEHIAINVLKGKFIYVESLGWMEYKGNKAGGGKYIESSEIGAVEAVRRYCLSQLRRAVAKVAAVAAMVDASAVEVRQSEALAEAWRSLCSKSRLSAVTTLTQGQRGVRKHIDSLDANPDALNTPTGVVCLMTGELRPSTPDDLMTRCTRAPYKGLDYSHDVWEQALAAVPEDAQEWIHTYMGQAITGYLNSEDRLLLIDGEGSNGKGVLTNEGAVWSLGDYALLMPETLLMSPKGVHPVEFMSLRGVRLALLDETPEARVLDTQRLKKIIGQPQMTARELYQKNVTFTLRHTVVVATNHLPRVVETDHGTWRRLVRMRMPLTFRKPHEAIRNENDRIGDPRIKTLLKTDRDVQAACLAWLVRGSVAWFNGCRMQTEMPERIENDTRQWRDECDPIQGFLTEVVEFDKGCHVTSEDLTTAFNAWLEGMGHRAWSTKLIMSRMRGHELTSDNGGIHPIDVCGKPVTVLSKPAGHGAHTSSGLGSPSRYRAFSGLKFRTGEEFDLPA